MKNIKITLISIAILFAITSVIYSLFINKQDSFGSNAKPLPAKYSFPLERLDTSDWLTYENKEYGIRFKYPREFEVMHNKHSGGYAIQIGIFGDIDYVNKLPAFEGGVAIFSFPEAELINKSDFVNRLKYFVRNSNNLIVSMVKIPGPNDNISGNATLWAKKDSYVIRLDSDFFQDRFKNNLPYYYAVYENIVDSIELMP